MNNYKPDKSLRNEKTHIIIQTTDEELNFISPQDPTFTIENYINGLDIKWTYKDNDDKPADFDIEIQGLSRDTSNKIKLKDNVIINAGYGDNLFQICTGFVIKKEYDRGTLKLNCSELAVTFNKVVSCSYEPNITGSQIIQDLANRIGFHIKQIDLLEDLIYSTGESIHGHGLKELENIVKDCSSKINIKTDLIYIYHDEIVTEGKLILDYTSGLLEEPKSQNIPEIKIEDKKKESKKESKKGGSSGKDGKNKKKSERATKKRK